MSMYVNFVNNRGKIIGTEAIPDKMTKSIMRDLYLEGKERKANVIDFIKDGKLIGQLNIKERVYMRTIKWPWQFVPIDFENKSKTNSAGIPTKAWKF